MDKFNPGDTIKCIDNDTYTHSTHRLTVGALYTVIPLRDVDATYDGISKCLVRITDDVGQEYSFYADRFVLHNAADYYEFNIGDYVLCINTDGTETLKVGTVYQISMRRQGTLGAMYGLKGMEKYGTFFANRFSKEQLIEDFIEL